MRFKTQPSSVLQFIRLVFLASFLGLCTTGSPLATYASPVVQQKAAELVLIGGNVFTVDKSRPAAEAIAISKSRIVAIGSNDTIKAHIGDETKVVDLKGNFVMPGFIEGHAHFVGLGESMMMLVSRVNSFVACV